MKHGLAAVLLVVLAASHPGAASAETGPPLEGVFADNFTLAEEPLPAPQEPVARGDGSEVSLAEFVGEVVLR